MTTLPEVTARSWRPLVQGWLWTAVLELALVGFVWYLPLAADLVQPLYVVAILPGLWGTWRWLRPRRTRDRREADRRHAPRRSDEPPSPPSSPPSSPASR